MISNSPVPLPVVSQVILAPGGTGVNQKLAPVERGCVSRLQFLYFPGHRVSDIFPN